MNQDIAAIERDAIDIARSHITAYVYRLQDGRLYVSSFGPSFINAKLVSTAETTIPGRTPVMRPPLATLTP